jgi:hypothetical protein
MSISLFNIPRIVSKVNDARPPSECGFDVAPLSLLRNKNGKMTRVIIPLYLNLSDHDAF